MRDEEAQVKTNGVQKKEGFKYKLWVLAAILLLAGWTMFTGSITLSLNWKHLSAKPHSPAIHEDLDLLEVEEREKVVRHMWDVYTESRTARLPKFWQEAFEAAYEDMMSDSSAVRDAAVTEIAKMSLHSKAKPESPPIQSNSRELESGTGKKKGN
ncbi:PREDICTED: uncharacterized protein LOC109170413 [Ipomoea nil]|uniref:uncharacterized protein LOC109170413 n=1 Tax=Ipomoea nil TaxID=35883 RepID=UPI00090085DD|nr:PREDICTED: uncharacterized protein LOC109170413 [Ipomoea nil]